MDKLNKMKSNSSKVLRKEGRQNDIKEKKKKRRKKERKDEKSILEKIYTFRKQKQNVCKLSSYPLGM